MERGGPLSRTQISSLLELAHQQELLRDETGRVVQSLDPANIFRVALSVAVDAMGRASALLQRRQTGPATQQAEQNAIDRLKLILAAMEAEEPGEDRKRRWSRAIRAGKPTPMAGPAAYCRWRN